MLLHLPRKVLIFLLNTLFDGHSAIVMALLSSNAQSKFLEGGNLMEWYLYHKTSSIMHPCVWYAPVDWNSVVMSNFIDRCIHNTHPNFLLMCCLATRWAHRLTLFYVQWLKKINFVMVKGWKWKWNDVTENSFITVLIYWSNSAHGVLVSFPNLLYLLISLVKHVSSCCRKVIHICMMKAIFK